MYEGEYFGSCVKGALQSLQELLHGCKNGQLNPRHRKLPQWPWFDGLLHLAGCQVWGLYMKGDKHLHRMALYKCPEWVQGRNYVKGNNNMKAYHSVHSAALLGSTIVL